MFEIKLCYRYNAQLLSSRNSVGGVMVMQPFVCGWMSRYNAQLLSPRNSVGGVIEMRLFVCGWVSEWVPECVRTSVALYLVDTIATKVFVQSLSNFTCKLWMMRGGTLLILGHGVKGQGQLWHSVYKTLWTWYRLQFLSNHFQLYM